MAQTPKEIGEVELVLSKYEQIEWCNKNQSQSVDLLKKHCQKAMATSYAPNRILTVSQHPMNGKEPTHSPTTALFVRGSSTSATELRRPHVTRPHLRVLPHPPPPYPLLHPHPLPTSSRVSTTRINAYSWALHHTLSPCHPHTTPRGYRTICCLTGAHAHALPSPHGTHKTKTNTGHTKRT